jgi:hypothetical protein
MVTSSQYNAFKEDVLHNQPIRKTINLHDLKFLTMDTVEFSGLRLGITRSGFRDLLKIVGISIAGMENIEASVGEDGAQKFLNALKNAVGQAKGLQVTLSVTPDRVISRISRTASNSLISTETYFETVDRLVNAHNLDIIDYSFNKENGNVGISTVSRKGGLQVGNFNDESFKTGMSFAKTASGIIADPYLQREICTNGMVVRSFQDSFKLESMQPGKWQEFFQHIERIEKGGFVPPKFEQAVKSAMITPASLRELERGTNLLLSNSNIESPDLEMFFKGRANTYYTLAKAGIDVEELSQAQKANVRTPIPLWDVINGVTDFSSHNYGFEKRANSDRFLQVQAGDMLSSRFDNNNQVMNQPF